MTRNRKKPIFREIATTKDGRDVTRGYVSTALLPPQDTVLTGTLGGNYARYQELLRDPQVFSCWQQRQLAVLACETEVIAGGTKREDRKAADFIDETINHIGFDNVTEKMHYGRFYGYAVGECIWAIDGGKVYAEKIKVRKQRRFRFDADEKLRLLTRESPNGELLPDQKFWTFQVGGDNDDEPYGLGLAHNLFWPVWFKKNDIKFWLYFLEKFGQPTAWGQHDVSASKEEKDKLLAAIEAIQNDTGIVTPKGTLIEFLEASRSGSADYEQFLEYCDKSISKVILSQTMTTDDGGSYSQSKVHENVAQHIIKADADLLCSSFNNTVVRWLTDWNFPGAAYPKVWRRVEQEEDVTSRAKREDLIVKWGYRPSIKYLEDIYDLQGWVDSTQPTERNGGAI